MVGVRHVRMHMAQGFVPMRVAVGARRHVRMRMQVMPIVMGMGMLML